VRWLRAFKNCAAARESCVRAAQWANAPDAIRPCPMRQCGLSADLALCSTRDHKATSKPALFDPTAASF